MSGRLSQPRTRRRDPRAQPPGPAPFGYVRDGSKRLVISSEYRDILEHIAHWRSQGCSAQAIADGLNGDGIPAPKGGKWGRYTVLKIAKREMRSA